MNDVINRKDAIGAILSIGHIAELRDGDAVIRVSAVNYVLRNLPSEDVQPVQRGHWQEAKTRTYGIYECDVCKGWTYIPNKPRDYKFCPRCGARMDGE